MATSKVAVIGSGMVGETLASGFLKYGHEVRLASRDPSKLEEWNAAAGERASVGTFGDASAWADLVVCRAGALTISELMAVGVASILVPYPYAVDDHQTLNARFLSDTGAASLLPQPQLNPESLADLLGSLLSDRGRLHHMGLTAYRLARRDATRRVADLCEELAA